MINRQEHGRTDIFGFGTFSRFDKKLKVFTYRSWKLKIAMRLTWTSTCKNTQLK
jgi:hypothetical protein